MDVFTLSAKLTLDSSEFNTGLATSEGKMSKWSVAAGNLVSAGVTKAARALKDLGKSTIETGEEFSAMMSQVQAHAVGATGEEIDALSKKAQELGASTKFTATEVAQAFDYMAYAGWKPEQMLAGIESILNLSAASGENLGRTSDIVTDALTAFGLTADDVAHFVDVLAVASASSNTNVDKLGEAFKYVATNGGLLGYSIDDVAVALGLMANNGIKGSQAGTSLRRILQNLVAPSDKAASAMSKLGLSLFEDGTDKAKPLLQVISELREIYKNSDFDLGGKSLDEIQPKLDELNAWYDEWKGKLESSESGIVDYLGKNINADDLDKMYKEKLQSIAHFNEDFLASLSAIGGVRGVTALIAMMKTTDEDFESLVGQISNSEEAAQNMAATMLDNLKGDITILNSAIDGLKILVSEDFKSSFRSFVQTLTGGVQEISQGFQESGLVGLITTFADKLISGIADWLVSNPEKVTQVIESFIQIITDTAPKLVEALVAVLSNPDLWVALGDMFKNIWQTLFGTPDKNLANNLFGGFEQTDSNPLQEYVDAYNEYQDILNKMQTMWETGQTYTPEYTELEESLDAAEKKMNSLYETASKIFDTNGKSLLSSYMTWMNEHGGLLEGGKLPDVPVELIPEDKDVTDKMDAGYSATVTLIPDDSRMPDGTSFDGSHASGLDYVPYDDYRAKLHRGEMVLTSSQARQYREGGSMDYSGLLSGIVNAVRQGMEGAVVKSYLSGKEITDEVTRNMGNAMKARRYAT